MDKTKLKQFIIQLSAEAGEYLRNHFYTFKNVIEHTSGGLTTNIDIELGEIIKKRIADEFPDHQIIIQGEEPSKTKSDFVWLADPLEGSSHFSRNVPVYTVNIALQHKGEVIMAVVNHPQTNQLFFAQKNSGAYLNGIEISVSQQTDLDKAFIFVEMPEKKFTRQLEGGGTFDDKMSIVSKLVEKAGQVETFRIGSFGQCLVAAGSFDAYIDLSGSSQALSQAAANLIIKEAGGEIIDLQKPQNGFIQILATNGKLSEKLEEIINESR